MDEAGNIASGDQATGNAPLFETEIEATTLKRERWKLVVYPDFLTLKSPADLHPTGVTRLESADKIELPPWPRVFVLIKPKRLVFKIDEATHKALLDWFGPPTEAQLRATLKRRFSFSLPLAIFLTLIGVSMIAARRMNGHPRQVTDWFFIVWGIGFGICGALARSKPHRSLFLAEAMWLVLLVIYLVNIIVSGRSWLWGILILMNFIGISQTIKLYRRFAPDQMAR